MGTISSSLYAADTADDIVRESVIIVDYVHNAKVWKKNM